MAVDLHGSLVALTRNNIGDEIEVAAGITATTLSLVDVSDFDEDGGQVTINGVVYTYDTVDMGADTIHLTSGLTAAAAVGDRVDLWDPDAAAVVSEQVALVIVDDQDGDPINAIVDHSLASLLPEDTLLAGQSVTLRPDGAAHRVSEVHGKKATLGGSAVDYGNFSGTTDANGLVLVPHSLGVTPSAVFITPTVGTHPSMGRFNGGSSDASNFGVTFRLTTTDALSASTSVNFVWLALP